MLQTNKIKTLPQQLRMSHVMGITSRPNWSLMHQVQNVTKDREPEGIDGYFLIPHWSEISLSYGGAITSLINHLSQSNKLRVTQDVSSLFKSIFLMETKRKLMSIADIQREQGSKISIIPVQLGAKYVGKSAHEAIASMLEHEFPLGLYEVCYIVLHHSELLEGSLYIECPGDRLSPDGNGIFSHIPVLEFYENEIHFSASCPENSYFATGIASAIFGKW